MSLMPIEQAKAWRYALALYHYPPLAELAINLQDAYGMNVNGLLLAAYLDHVGASVPSDWGDELKSTITDSEYDLCQHRLKRRQAKPGPLHIYQALKDEELQMEFAQHERMISLINQRYLSVQAVDACVQPQATALESFLSSYDLPQSCINEVRDRLLVAQNTANISTLDE